MQEYQQSSRQSRASQQSGSSRRRSRAKDQLENATSYEEQQAAVQPPQKQEAGKEGDDKKKPAAPVPKAEDYKAARSYNLESHSVSMLIQVREFLIKNKRLAETSKEEEGYVDMAPPDIVTDAFIKAVWDYQVFKKMKGPDGKLGPNTFALFEKQGLKYSKTGGAQTPNVKDSQGKSQPRNIIPKGASDKQKYDFFKKVILENKGVFFEKPGYVNIIGIRGGKYDEKEKTVTHVENKFNQWNDTLITLRIDDKKVKHVEMFEGTVDPGVAKKNVATLPEGTYAYKKGIHKDYTALTPAYAQRTPAFRKGEAHLGREKKGGALGINIHTTHGYKKDKLNGPGGYSEGCSVIDGEDCFDDFIDDVKTAAKSTKKGGAGQTIFYYTLIAASRVEGLTIDKQEKQAAEPQAAQ